MQKKYRSMKKALDYQERKLGGEAAPGPRSGLSALRVLAAVRKHSEGMTLAELTKELDADEMAVEAAAFDLIKQDLVRLEGERIVAIDPSEAR